MRNAANKREERRCYCGEILTDEGICPNGCTEDSNHGVLGACEVRKSFHVVTPLEMGVCPQCGSELKCDKGCYDPGHYRDDDRFDAETINLAIDSQECLVCHRIVKCPKGHEF